MAGRSSTARQAGACSSLPLRAGGAVASTLHGADIDYAMTATLFAEFPDTGFTFDERPPQNAKKLFVKHCCLKLLSHEKASNKGMPPHTPDSKLRVSIYVFRKGGRHDW